MKNYSIFYLKDINMESLRCVVTVMAIVCSNGIMECAKPKPQVMLISMDGFRHDYFDKARTPNFDDLRRAGVSMPYMNNTFQTSTFPNHYTIATGLYTESHGIISNRMYDPLFDAKFHAGNIEERWWNEGEPMWATATKQGLKAGVYFWPGSEASYKGLTPDQWSAMKYNSKGEDFTVRINTTIQWLVQGYDLVMMYFHEPDSTGHKVGPDDPAMIPVIERMDAVLGQVMLGLWEAGLHDDVNLIVTSDHGMAQLDMDHRQIDLSKYANSSLILDVVDQGTKGHIRAQPGQATRLKEALSGIDHLTVYLKDEIPERFHMKHNRRVMDVLALPDEGWVVLKNNNSENNDHEKGGHGYDNYLLNMKPFFMATGPAFKSHAQVGPISNRDIYPLVCHLLNIQASPNNGSLQRATTLLDVHYAANSTTYVPPQTPAAITTSAHNFTLSKGQGIILPCDVTGNPPPKTTWLFLDEYGDPALVSAQVTTTPTGSDLVVEHVNEAGTFVCRSSNTLGTDTVQFGLKLV